MIREALLSSDRFLTLPDNTSRMCYIACLLTADDRGNREAGNGHLVRVWRDFGVDTTEKAAAIGQFLADQDLIRFYEVDGKRYLHVPRFNQRMRYLKRAYPSSPWCKTSDKSKEDEPIHPPIAGDSPTTDGQKRSRSRSRKELTPIARSAGASSPIRLGEGQEVETIPLTGEAVAVICQSHVLELERLYPGVDVPQTLKEIRGWNLANPTRRKTPAGIAKHINGWCAKEQNKA